jgi:serine/threonine protein kinase
MSFVSHARCRILLGRISIVYYLLLITDLQHIVDGKEGSSEALSDDLKDYFKDPSFGTPHRRTSSFDRAFFDASASRWDIGDEEDVSEWTIDESKDDIFVGGYRGNSQRRNSVPHFQNQANDFCPRRQAQRHKPEKAHYQYQICLFIQMQLCHPATLGDWIRARNQTMGDQSLNDRLETVAEIFNQIAAGLAHIHGLGIIHRDVKPSNIFASADGLHFKIGDFGLSKLIENAASKPVGGTTNHGLRFHRQQRLLLEDTKALCESDDTDGSWQDPLTVGVGTASYAAPEQVNGDLVYLQSFLNTAQEKLNLRDVFIKSLLFGMSEFSCGLECKLLLLNQGKETSLAPKQLIGEYLGVPLGKEVRLLRRATHELSLLIY